MADRTTEEIRALGKAAGLNINDQDLREVTFVLNSILTSLEKVNVPGLNEIEPLSIPIQEQSKVIESGEQNIFLTCNQFLTQ